MWTDIEHSISTHFITTRKEKACVCVCVCVCARNCHNLNGIQCFHWSLNGCMRNKQIDDELGRRGGEPGTPGAHAARQTDSTSGTADLEAPGLVSNERGGVLPAFRLLSNRQQVGLSGASQHLYIKGRPWIVFYILNLVPEAEVVTK